METLIRVAQFLLSFTILVGIHEFGHFIAARIFGMRVDKFYIMFNPWFSLFKIKRGDTEYGLGWLPLGGYCKIAGMIDESMDKEQMAQPPQPYEFRSKPAWQRLVVMLAGVILNIVGAIIIYIGISYVWGDTYLPAEKATWGYNFNSTAKEMGFKDGDKVVAIDGETIGDINDIRTMLILSDGDREVLVDRGGDRVTLNITFEQLLNMRKEKAYIDLYTLRMPFIVDSVVTNSALQKGDQIIGVNNNYYDEYSTFTGIFKEHSGETITLMALRNSEMTEIDVAVNSEGKIGVMVQN
ncbi:MAG: RIP metalloprotease RseP, partial [Rikenellaceae bacterium]